MKLLFEPTPERQCDNATLAITWRSVFCCLNKAGCDRLVINLEYQTYSTTTPTAFARTMSACQETFVGTGLEKQCVRATSPDDWRSAFCSLSKAGCDRFLFNLKNQVHASTTPTAYTRTLAASQEPLLDSAPECSTCMRRTNGWRSASCYVNKAGYDRLAFNLENQTHNTTTPKPSLRRRQHVK